MRSEKAEAGDASDDDDSVFDEDEDELDEEITPESPEGEWLLAKQQHAAVSPAIDKLMALTGLKNIKVRLFLLCSTLFSLLYHVWHMLS